jgi:hypothetical protein
MLSAIQERKSLRNFLGNKSFKVVMYFICFYNILETTLMLHFFCHIRDALGLGREEAGGLVRV